ncbi:MAG: D-alanyl-D-alanine carboxypeptidase [Oscillospiraceae bacterium]|nr:D-alanyl-D-alanine carboxypeptidase [Oscillospiraceae bacterium]
MKKCKIIKYIYPVLFLAISLLILSANIVNVAAEPVLNMDMAVKTQIQSGAFVLMDGDTGQVLLEKNMNEIIYPASITKIMTAMIALEKGKLTDTVTMSYDAVFSVGRDTSHIALDEEEELTLENALYGLAICSANDAANGIAELIGGSMPEFARQMTARAKELGAVNTNFTNAHGLPDANHYTTSYDMARIMAAAVKIPEFTKIFSSVSYDMPPTNKQPEARQFNRKNSLIEGFYKYDGIIAEKTGWTSDAGYTYVAAAKRNGKTLIVAVINSPSEVARWEDATVLFDYGFNEFTPVSYNAEELKQEQYIIEGANGSKLNTRLIPGGDFSCFILKSLNKEDIKIKYIFSTDDITGKIESKALFLLNSELSGFIYTELGEIDLQMYFNSETYISPVNGNITNNNDQQIEHKENGPILSAILSILKILSIILQIIGGLTVIWLILYIRRNIIVQKRKKRRFDYNNAIYK